jgi:hypothetical protein
MYEDVMPSGKRIYELTAESMKIDKMAYDGCSLSYELYVADFEQAADRFARRLNDTENRFFETACAIGNNYRPPEAREENEQSASEIRRDLARELYGEQESDYDEDYDYDEVEQEENVQDMTDKEAQKMIAARAEITQLERDETRFEPGYRSPGFHGPEDPGQIPHKEKTLEYSQKYQSGERYQLPSHQAEKFDALHARLTEMKKTTRKIISVDRVQIIDGEAGYERNIIYKDHDIMSNGFEQLDNAMKDARSRGGSTGFEQLENAMKDATLRSGYDEQKLRIAQLESWVAEVISRPWMPRELRMEGLELVGAQRPDVRQAVERICPTQTLEQGMEQSIER